MILTLYDISGIQKYIFSSSKLREQVGGSNIVHQILYECLPKILEDDLECTALLHKDEWLLPDVPTQRAHIVYIGGGNAMVLYRDRESESIAGRALQKKVFDLTAGQLKICHACVDLSAKGIDSLCTEKIHLQDLYEELMEGMAEYKREANTLYPSQGSSLSAYDNAGFEVISYCEKENIYGPFSRIMKANKYEQRKDITDVEGAKFADQFEHLREKDKKSFVAVIHVDGNRLGQKISNALRNKRNLKEEMLQFCCSSLQIDKLFKETLDETIRINFRNELAKGESLPFRPIVRDGDDITLIVKADRAFAFIQVYMEQLAEKQVSKEYIHLKENIGNISATAGAVFVRDTFPFDEAYDLAEQLCKAGKAKLADEGRDVSCMDYHILREGLTGSVREYRQAHYQIAGGQLHIRPYLFTDSGEDSYDSFLHLRNALTASEIARNKLKALRNAYSESVQEAEYTYRTILSRHKNGIDHQKNAFVDKNGKKRAVFFDVLDVMDI